MSSASASSSAAVYDASASTKKEPWQTSLSEGIRINYNAKMDENFAYYTAVGGVSKWVEMRAVLLLTAGLHAV